MSQRPITGTSTALAGSLEWRLSGFFQKSRRHTASAPAAAIRVRSRRAVAAPPGGRGRSSQSEFDLLGDADGIVDLNPEIADGTLQFGVACHQG